MSVAVVRKKMLYCPKCQKTYDDGSQRFCINDGGRLLPAQNTSKAENKQTGVFTNLLGRIEPRSEHDEKLASIPRFVRSEQTPLPSFQPPKDAKLFKDDNEIELELEPVKPIEKPKPIFPPIKQELPKVQETPKIQELPKPLPRTVKPEEIPSGQASLGDRQTNPTGRLALTMENPRVLVGQVVKGRYQIVEILGANDSSLSYLAEDKLSHNKKVFLRVLMEEGANDEFTRSIYAEERTSLSLINHPNVARVVDSGELPEGKPFVVTEYTEAGSIKTLLQKGGQLNVLRTARIIRQTAYALSEVHQNGILHRNLKPENILLSVSEAGTEQVKLTNFGISNSKTKENVSYKAPEVLEGKTATFAGDIFSLAVIAYEMLTNRLPFHGENTNDLLKHEREGLTVHPTNLRLDLPPFADEVLEKALSYNPTDRYPKSRDFGDAFFNALTTAAAWDKKDEPTAEKIEILPPKKNEIFLSPIVDEKPEIKAENVQFAETVETEENAVEEFQTEAETEELPILGDIHITPREAEMSETEEITEEASEPKRMSEATWTRRSPEPPKTSVAPLFLISMLGLALIMAGIWAWYYFLSRPNQPEIVNPVATNTQISVTPINAETPQNTDLKFQDLEIPPLPRQISQPPNTLYFQNSKQEAKGDLLKNFLPFTLYYPKDWKANETLPIEKAGTRSKFLDISRKTESGVPIENMLVSYYDSKGTFKDDKFNFPKLVKETNETLSKIIPNYMMFSESETKVNGWKAYEIKFQGAGETSTGEKLIVWGRRLFIPVSRSGVKNGYEITMLATSKSNDVKSVDDVGVKGELATILETFEPIQNY